MRKLTTVLAVLAGMIMTTGVAAASDGQCHNAGDTSLTASYVNEVPTGPIDVTCDIGIYFNTDATISGVEINGTVDDAKSEQHGIYIDAADVDVTDSTVTVAEDYPNQFVSATYRNGATGTFDSNELTGAHRAALVLRGEDTDVTVTQNEVVGTGAKTTGWAENGIQVDQGAVASITHNTVANHWWDGESNWASTGIMLYGDDNVMNNNTFTDNEFAAYVFGSDNEVKANRVNANVESQSPLDFQAYGFLVAGGDNALIGNQMRAGTNAAAGIYLYPGSDNNTIRGGNIKGFDYPIVEGGNETAFTGNPALMN